MNNTTTPAESTTVPAAPARNWRVIGSSALALTALAAATLAGFHGGHRESTEDAFVDGNVVSVTAQVGGVVTSIAADNTDFVSAGSSLIRLDDVDTRLARARAEAQLAKAVRQVRAQFASASQMKETVTLREVDLAKAKADLARREQLEASGAVAGEDVKHARDAVRAAAASLAATRQQLAASEALIDRSSIEANPDVLNAAAQLRDAIVAMSRTAIPAPVTGVVTKRTVQIGQKINPGVALMSVVPLNDLWVNANFKESQLRDIRVGQPVSLVADLYGRSLVFHGTVIGKEAGTGSAFSLLPAQNASGNWIKVVQRVPVRIALDPAEVLKHPLQLGLSMKVTVDTKATSGDRLAVSSVRNHRSETDVFATQLAQADDAVRQVIDANR